MFDFLGPKWALHVIVEVPTAICCDISTYSIRYFRGGGWLGPFFLILRRSMFDFLCLEGPLYAFTEVPSLIWWHINLFKQFFFCFRGVARAIFLDFATVDVRFFMPRRGLTCYYRDPNFDLVTNEPTNQSMVNNSDIFIFWWNVHFMSICLFY